MAPEIFATHWVRSAIVWAGPPDPGSTRLELREKSDEKMNVLRRIMAGWQEIDPDSKGLTVKQAREHLTEHPQHFETLRTAIEDLAPSRAGKPATNRTVGMKLRALEQKVVDRKCMSADYDRLGQLWSVKDFDAAQD